MLILTGNNLGKRQQELNEKVKEAAINNVDFNEVKEAHEISDIDKLFKIDLASKYKNIEYIVETLKCGDSLYISRALKCLWIYDDEFSAIINTDYLHHNIFPFMSLKMKKKTLTSTSVYVRSEIRATSFFRYCLTTKMTKIAFKFLIFTPESFKLNLIQDQIEILTNFIYTQEGEYIKYFIGNSFALADAYLNKISDWVKNDALHELRYLHSVDNEKYLDLLEKYGKFDVSIHTRIKRFGLRISQEILKKHKNRVLKCPALYINKLNKNVFVKLSTCDDAKKYAVAVLPNEAKIFWDMDYFCIYEHIFNVIPNGEKFEFIKKIFTNKFPGEAFEMNVKFYNLQMYKMMTEKQREDWALSHLASNKELLGSGQDYIWYKFVNFEKALVEIKKYIMITPDVFQRGYIINVLTECARNQKDLEIVLNYFYERHVNEIVSVKTRFIDKLLEHHKVYNFDEKCWTVFNKILYSLNVYDSSHCVDDRYKLIATLYHIIHDKDLPEPLQVFLKTHVNLFSYYLRNEFIELKKMSKDKGEGVYKYLIHFYTDILTSFEGQTYNDEIKDKAKLYIQNVLELMILYDKPKEECPEIVMKYAKLHWNAFKNYKLFQEKTNIFSEGQMIRLLKQDAQLVVDEFPLMRRSIDWNFRINNLLRKVKIYFSNDFVNSFITFFEELLQNSNEFLPVYVAVYGLFQLADEKFKTDFMTKYSPIEPKIKHDKIDRQLLLIQESICRFAYYSRPPVPLTKMLMYVKGDYVKYCVPMFNSYLSHLPSPLCIEFVKATLDSPVSVQKHSLRLAFKCFNTENLKKLILDVWKKTRNISLRMIIYKALFNKILEEDEIAQIELIDVLKTLNSDLHQDDHDDIFNLITSDKIPENFRGDYLKSGWKSISKLPEKSANFNRKTNVIKRIEHNIHLIDEDFLRSTIYEHVHTTLASISNLVQAIGSYEYNKYEVYNLNRAKWELVACFIVKFNTKEKPEKNFELVELIMKKCFEMWDEVFEDVYVTRKLWSEFVSDLVSKSLDREETSQVNPIFDNLLKDLQSTRPLQEIYLTVWKLKLAMITRKVIDDGRIKLEDKNENDKTVVIKLVAIKFAAEIVNLVKEFINKQQYFKNFFSEIQEKITVNINDISNTLQAYKYSNLISNDLLVFVALGLTDFKIADVYLLALNILPSECPEKSKAEFEVVVSRIKKFEDNEVQCSMYQKFVGVDFKRRKYV